MTPLILITGFLGAGKTSLLRAVLPRLSANGIRPHVVLNDYQNARVDAATLNEYTALVDPISGTCVCCGSRDEMLDTMRDAPLSEQSVLLLEANGTADTGQLIEILSVDRRAAAFTLPIQVVMVDCKRWQKRYWHNRLEKSQVATAGYVMFTRLDQANRSRVEAVEQEVATEAPRARVVNAEQLATAITRLVREAPALPPRRFEADPFRPAQHPPHAHTHHFSSMEIPLSTRVPRGALETFLRNLPPEVIRAKGIAYLTNEELPVYFQRTDQPDSLSLKPVKNTGAYQAVAVLIGIDLDVAKLRARADTMETSE